MAQLQPDDLSQSPNLFDDDDPTLAERTAHWISNIVSPPLMLIVSAVLVTTQVDEHAWRWAFLFMSAAVLLPVLYLVWLLRRGSINDIHVPMREQRIRPYIVTLLVALPLLFFFVMWPAPQPFQVLATMYALQAMACLVITLRWKISLHSAAVSSAAVLGWTTVGWSGVALALTVPVVAWARVHLRRHTLMQTIGGALLGVVAVYTAMWLIGAP